MIKWIEKMTSLDASRRPKADDLVDQVSMEHNQRARYGRSCCFEDVQSDNTSWQGSIPEDDIFETAHTISDLTTISTGSMRTPLAPIQDVPSILQLSTPSGGRPGLLHEEAHRLVTAPYPSTNLIMLSTDTTTERDSTIIEVQEAFIHSHERLESVLLQQRSQGLDWSLGLSFLIENSVRDSKGFNILHVACKMNNTMMAYHIVELVVQTKSELVFDQTHFKNSALHYAARSGRTRIVEQLMKSGAQATVQNIRSQTPLHLAVRRNRIAVVQMLLSGLSKDQVDTQDDHGETALHLACGPHPSVRIIKALLAADADITVKNRWGVIPIQASELCANKTVTEAMEAEVSRKSIVLGIITMPSLEVMLRQVDGLDISDCFCDMCLLRIAMRSACVDDSSEQPFCSCPNHVRVFVEDTLSSRGRNNDVLCLCPCTRCVAEREYNTKHTPCGTPIGNDYSSYNDELEDFQRVVAPYTEPPTQPSSADFAGRFLPPYPGHQYYDRLIAEKFASSIPKLSQQEVTTIVLKSLADAGFRGSKSYRKKPDKALNWVISHYQDLEYVDKVVEILLDSGGNVDIICEGKTLLRVAAEHQDLVLMQLLLDRKATVDLLIPWIPFLASKLFGHVTAFRMAVNSNSVLSIRMLLRAGANVNNQSVSSKTMLHNAIVGYDTIGWHIPMLLAHGAATELRDKDGDTPLHAAVRFDRIHAARALLESGADVEASKEGNVTPLSIALEGGDKDMITLLLTYGADVHYKCDGSPCALFRAVEKGHGDIARLFIEEYSADEDIHKKKKNNRTLLHELAASPISDPKLYDLLLGYGINMDVESDHGFTPLHCAASKGNVLMVTKLIEKGATIHLQDHNGETPLDIAQSARHWDVVEILGGTRKKSWWRR
jgi:ankyrin repeat protein